MVPPGSEIKKSTDNDEVVNAHVDTESSPEALGKVDSPEPKKDLPDAKNGSSKNSSDLNRLSRNPTLTAISEFEPEQRQSNWQRKENFQSP